MEVAKDVVLGIFEIFVSLLTGHWSKGLEGARPYGGLGQERHRQRSQGRPRGRAQRRRRAALDLYKGAFAAGRIW